MTEQVQTSDWRVTVTYRNRDRMKLQFKLSKEESEAFKNFMVQTRPDEIAEDDFIKGIFNLGMQTLEQQIMAQIQKEMEAKQKEQEESVDVSGATTIIE